MTSKLEVIPEFATINFHVDSDNEIEELQEKMNCICNQIAQEFYKIKYQSVKVSEILETNFNKSYLNNNFDNQEQIEEQIDILIYQYAKIKEKLRVGRLVRYNMEKKQKQKSNELKYARNLLEYFGINPEYNN